MEENPGLVEYCIEDGDYFVSTHSPDSSGRRLFLGVSTTDSSPGKFPIITLPSDVQPSNPELSKRPPKWRLTNIDQGRERFLSMVIEKKTVDIFKDQVVAAVQSAGRPLGMVESCKCCGGGFGVVVSAVSICGIHRLKLESPSPEDIPREEMAGIRTVSWEIHPDQELPLRSVRAFIPYPIQPGQPVRIAPLATTPDIETENRMFVITGA